MCLCPAVYNLCLPILHLGPSESAKIGILALPGGHYLIRGWTDRTH